jgi:DNA-binding HxlR family transcriptional regulator
MSPLRSDWSEDRCPIARSLDIVGDPWILLILRDALLGSRRYDQFRRSLGIADNVLTKRLGAMVEAGLLRKSPYRDEHGRERQEYLLTKAGEDLMPVLHALVLWGEKHAPSGDRSELGIVHTTCGARTASADHCDSCGERLTPGAVPWARSWRPQLMPLTAAPAVSE